MYYLLASIKAMKPDITSNEWQPWPCSTSKTALALQPEKGLQRAALRVDEEATESKAAVLRPKLLSNS